MLYFLALEKRLQLENSIPDGVGERTSGLEQIRKRLLKDDSKEHYQKANDGYPYVLKCS